MGFKDDVDQKEIESLIGTGGKCVKDDEVVVDKARFDELVKKEVMFDQMCKVIEAGGALPKKGGGLVVGKKREKWKLKRKKRLLKIFKWYIRVTLYVKNAG